MNKWEKVKLGDVCDIKRGGSPRPIDKYITEDVNGINWIKIGDTSDDSMYITKTKQKILPEGMKKSRYVQPGDFLLSNSMSFGKPYILKIGGCIHDGWLVLRDKDSYFHKEYLYYALSNKTTYEKFKSLAVGGVVNNLNSTVVKQVEIPLPPLETQKQIAKTLDTVAELLAMRKQQLAELDNLIKSIFYDMFGDPVTNEKGWKILPLGEVCEITSSKRIFESEYVYQGIPFYRTKEIVELSNGNPVTTELYISSKRYEEIRNKFDIPHTDDILISAVGTIGTTWVVPNEEPFYFKDGNLLWVKNSSSFNSIYLSFLLKILIKHYTSNLIVGSAYNALTIIKVKRMLSLLPPISLQNKFAKIVTKIEEQKALVQKAIDETQYLFDSLMSEYFDDVS